MGNGSLQGLRVAILVTDGFEQVQLEKPRTALDDARAETFVVFRDLLRRLATPLRRTRQGSLSHQLLHRLGRHPQ